MLSAICKNADFDFDDADEDEYDPILGIKFSYRIMQRVHFGVYEVNNLLKINSLLIQFTLADKKKWKRGEHAAIPSESSRPINESELENMRKTRLAELEMW